MGITKGCAETPLILNPLLRSDAHTRLMVGVLEFLGDNYEASCRSMIEKRGKRV